MKAAIAFTFAVSTLFAAQAVLAADATPAGKTGYIQADTIAPLGNDQICYIKDGKDWKVTGYIGAGDPQ